MTTTDYRLPTQFIRYCGLENDYLSINLVGHIARPHKPVNANKHVV